MNNVTWHEISHIINSNYGNGMKSYLSLITTHLLFNSSYEVICSKILKDKHEHYYVYKIATVYTRNFLKIIRWELIFHDKYSKANLINSYLK